MRISGSLTFSGNEENVRTIMRHPAHTAGSDGITVGDRPHPRAWGTFARYLAEYVRALGLVGLEEMIRKMTSLPCRRLGFRDRGVIREGAAADLVCFDADRVQDTATYDNPRQHPSALERRAMLMNPQPAQAERGFGGPDHIVRVGGSAML